jgi:hypothetical protein
MFSFPKIQIIILLEICWGLNICILQTDKTLSSSYETSINPNTKNPSEPLILFYLFAYDSTNLLWTVVLSTHFELAFCSFSNLELVMIPYVLSIVNC